MDAEPDVIRQQIDATRESLSEKLETLEGHVKDAVGSVTDTIETVKNTVENTVESVKTGVESTVENVKSSLSDTVDTVKETFNISRQIDSHPWAVAGCSLLAGMATGYMLSERDRNRPHPQGISGMNRLIPNYEPSRPMATHQQETPRSSLLQSLLGPFEGELDKIKQTAIGALMGIARDALKQALPPSLAENVKEIFDDATRRAGGEPVRGSVLEQEPEGQFSGARHAKVC